MIRTAAMPSEAIVWPDGRIWVPVWPIAAPWGLFASGWVLGVGLATMRTN